MCTGIRPSWAARRTASSPREFGAASEATAGASELELGQRLARGSPSGASSVGPMPHGSGMRGWLALPPPPLIGAARPGARRNRANKASAEDELCKAPCVSKAPRPAAGCPAASRFEAANWRRGVRRTGGLEMARMTSRPGSSSSASSTRPQLCRTCSRRCLSCAAAASAECVESGASSRGSFASVGRQPAPACDDAVLDLQAGAAAPSVAATARSSRGPGHL
mmetsp:Transcript_83884/g.234098  ORF Transcript_83884/g.234098 Transcript_83884/m.234098 type:complete len:223 (+) Transcript_83884:700-1368(+)